MFIVLITKSYDKSVWCNFSVHCQNYYKFVFDWNMYKTGSISESLTPYPPVTDEKYPCQDEGNG